MTEHSWERRWQPLFQEWVVISANTAERPWSGAEFEPAENKDPKHDPTCYLCPGNTRAKDKTNPLYQQPWAFDNDFPSLSFAAPNVTEDHSELHRVAPAHGVCRVLCWHPRHDKTLAELAKDELFAVVKLWQKEFRSIRKNPDIKHILIFENKGMEIGVSNPHPHGQIYASSFVSRQINTMRQAQFDYHKKTKKSLVLDLLLLPRHREFIIEENDHFILATPFAPRFAYESWIVPKRLVNTIDDLSEDELKKLSEIHGNAIRRYNNLFQREAPNITLLHNAPVDTDPQNTAWQFMIIFQPPLRDLTKLKYLAGFESGTHCIINPVQPEIAARRLQNSMRKEADQSCI